LHGDVLMWLMKTLLTSGCTNQRGAGQKSEVILSKHSKVLEAESMLTKNDVTHKAAELLEDKEV
ncbi:hypothetical protein, partial [Klebsiella pneumoniae]|uniref:hypothetical protein n=1 Tax=Klebsiella pneumoniae TaxID=573 RepID=UPI0028437DE1